MRIAAVAAVLILVVGCAGDSGSPMGSAPEPVVEVVAAAATPQTVSLTTTAVGAVEPVARVQVAAQAEGIVTAVHVREGDRVAQGQLVVELDDRELRADLAQAEASLEQAVARWQRVQSLRADGLLAEEDFDSARTTLRIGSARVDALRTRLSFARIEAPVAGVVIDRQVEVGDLASSRAPLLVLAAGDGLLLKVPVSELEVVRLAAGDRAQITVDALPGLSLEGRITRIFPAADRASRQVTVELAVDGAPPSVRFGFLARAHLELERMDDALVVPEQAVQRGADGGAFVWLVADGAARMRPVTVTHRLDGRAVLGTGIVAGDQVVVQGMARLRDGGPVRVEPAPTGMPS